MPVVRCVHCYTPSRSSWKFPLGKLWQLENDQKTHQGKSGSPASQNMDGEICVHHSSGTPQRGCRVARVGQIRAGVAVSEWPLGFCPFTSMPVNRVSRVEQVCWAEGDSLWKMQWHRSVAKEVRGCPRTLWCEIWTSHSQIARTPADWK